MIYESSEANINKEQILWESLRDLSLLSRFDLIQAILLRVRKRYINVNITSRKTNDQLISRYEK